MVTIKDVAKAAGVSVSVVSKALNGYPDIGAKTKDRILKVAREMNYTPNLAGRTLSSKKKLSIGLISSAVFSASRKDTNAFEVIKGIYRGVNERELELSVYLIDSEIQKEKSYARFCQERNIGGAILQGLRTDDRYFKELVDTNIPCVYVDYIAEHQSKNIGSVAVDNRKAGEEMARYLLEKKHRDIIVIAGLEKTFVNIERLEGVRNAFEAYGMELSDDAVLFADFSEEKAYQLAKAYLQKKKPTAFICFSDLMAYGVMKAVKEFNLSIPDDVSIIGFDDLPFSTMTNPPLSTVHQNFFDIGYQAAKLLLNVMENDHRSHHVVVEHRLEERESVKCNDK